MTNIQQNNHELWYSTTVCHNCNISDPEFKVHSITPQYGPQAGGNSFLPLFAILAVKMNINDKYNIVQDALLFSIGSKC